MVARYYMEMYSTNNEVQSVAAERLIKALKNRTCKCISSESKHVYW